MPHFPIYMWSGMINIEHNDPFTLWA